MGGLGLHPDQVRDSARRIAGGENAKYYEMLGNFEHNTKDQGTTFYGDMSKPVPSGGVSLTSKQVWNNWLSGDMATHLSAKPEELGQYISFFTQQLNSTNPVEVQQSLVALNEIEKGARSGIGTNNAIIDEQLLSKPDVRERRERAVVNLQEFIKNDTTGRYNRPTVSAAAPTAEREVTVGLRPQFPFTDSTAPYPDVAPPPPPEPEKITVPDKITAPELIESLTRPAIPPNQQRKP
jgi:hypothetical protein